MPSAPVLAGQIGLVVGVANKRSISWGIAKAAAAEGATIALTYQNERPAENVNELAATLQDPAVLPCVVTRDDELDALFQAINDRYHRLDFIVHGAAFAEREDLERPFLHTSRAGFA